MILIRLNEENKRMKNVLMYMVLISLALVLVFNFYGADIKLYKSNIFRAELVDEYEEDLDDIIINEACNSALQGLSESLIDYKLLSASNIDSEYTRVVVKHKDFNHILEIHLSEEVDEYKLTDKYFNLENKENVQVEGLDVSLKGHGGRAKLATFEKDLSFSIYAYDVFFNSFSRSDMLNLIGEISMNIDRNKWL